MTAIETYRLEVEAALGEPVSVRDVSMYMLLGFRASEATRRIRRMRKLIKKAKGTK
jgi:hypothetical protein